MFAGAIGPLDSKGRGSVVGIDVPIECGGVAVSRRLDFRAISTESAWSRRTFAERVIELSIEKVGQETKVRDDHAAGAPLASVFDRHGIL